MKEVGLVCSGGGGAGVQWRRWGWCVVEEVGLVCSRADW